MLQRIQTIYMILAVLSSGFLPHLFPLWQVASKVVFAPTIMPALLVMALCVTLGIVSIINFKKRQLQFVLNRLQILLNFILLGLFVYHLLNVSGGVTAPEKGIGMFLPLVSIFLLVFANKAIKKDETLVKSVDRIR